MGLTLQDLKAAMAPLAEIGKGELTFDVNGTTISLRALTPDEEIQVQRYSREAVAEGDLTDQANALEYLDRFRIGSLSYSIVQVGDLDFRNVDFVETGEKLPTGTPVKIRRHEAIQQLVGTWSRNMTVAVFKKFGELMNQVEKEVEGLVEFEPVDFDAEIARLEERVRELQEEKARMIASDEDARTNLRQQVAASGKSFRKPEAGAGSVTGTSTESQTSTTQEAETVTVPSDIDREISYEDEESPEPEVPTEKTVDPASATKSSEGPVPSTASRKPVFARGDVRMPPPAPVAAPPRSDQEEDQEQESPPQEGTDALPDVMSSMVDMADPEAAEKAVEIETRRIMEMRSAAKAARAVPPHLAAKQVAQEVERPVLSGVKDGVEVYKMPTQTLTDRKPPETAPTPARSNTNPRFKPTRSGG